MAATGDPEEEGLATLGGTWVIGFAANSGTTTLPDDVNVTVLINGPDGLSTVVVALTSGMTPGSVTTAVASGLANAGFAFAASGSEATFDDPDGDINDITIEYTTAGSNPAVDWLTESIGFRDLGTGGEA